jgi:cellulose synthase/poly-beta-1,6-N-acetylglucosamine synthase-like glycosyltransferase
MASYWLIAYLVVAGLAILQSALVALQTWEHRRYVRSCIRGPVRHRATGRAAVFAPCKGIDVELEGNLRALFTQDYDDYEVTFIVATADDPACAVIQRLMAEYPAVATRLVVAGRAAASGQKIHNLRAATAWLSPKIEYLAFLDSDSRPRADWLRVMASHLNSRRLGAVTGYRWFIPETDSITNRLLYSINCDIMSLLGRSSHCLIWGGSWGLRREVFESIGLHEAWSGGLADDLLATQQFRRAGLPVRFEPTCVVASPMDYRPRDMFSFARRQYMLGRFYVFDWWVFGLVAATLLNLVWLGNLTAVGCGWLWGLPSPWIPAGVLALLYALSVYRGMVRQDLIQTYFPERQQALRAARRIDVWASPLVGLVNWLAMAGSAIGRSVAWRGICYHVSPAGRVQFVRHEEEPGGLADETPCGLHEPDELVERLVSFRKAG